MTATIACRNVSRVYPDGTVALAPTSLKIKQGEHVALMGPSGSGKTTLVNVIGLLDTPSTGSVLYNGEDAREWSESKRSEVRAMSIGFVFQAFHLFDDRTVRENVEIGLVHRKVPRAEREGLIASAVGRVGLGHRADALVRTLSGGEQQRTAIARAIARRPQVLICDEPVGNLDADNARNVLDIIDSIHREGVTVVMVTHDPATAERSDRVVQLRTGNLGG